MYYKIGDISALFGLSNETLRNYEKAGLIHPKKREDSYFRRYDIDTVTKLMGIRSYRNEGYSLKELQRIYGDIGPEEYRALLKQKIGEQEQRVNYDALVLQKMREMEEKLADIRPFAEKICRRQSPCFYVLPYCVDSLIEIDKMSGEQLAQWTRNLFLVRHMHRFSADILKRPDDTHAIAMVAEQSVAEGIRLDCAPPVYRQEAQDCVYCNCMKPEGEDVFADIRGQLARYLEEHRLSVAGLPYFISTFAFHVKGRKVSNMDVYIPIRER